MTLKKSLTDLVYISKKHLDLNKDNETWQNVIFLNEIIHKFSMQIDFMRLFEIAFENDKYLKSNNDLYINNEIHFLYRLIIDFIIILYKRFEIYRKFKNEKNLPKLQVETLKKEFENFQKQSNLIRFLRDILFHIEYSRTNNLNRIFYSMEKVNLDIGEKVFFFKNLEKKEIEFSIDNFKEKYNFKNVNSSNKLSNYVILYGHQKEIGLQIGEIIIYIKCELFIGWLEKLLFELMNNDILNKCISFFNVFLKSNI